jgi:hypothetical protein
MIAMNVTLRRAAYGGVVLTTVALAVTHANADVCVYKPPTVQRVCGVLVDPSGTPIPGVNVTVLKDGTAVENTNSNDAGEFDFGALRAGKYELDATMSGFQHAQYQITLSKPSNSCKHALRVEMAVGSIHCGGDIRETKKPLSRKH